MTDEPQDQPTGEGAPARPLRKEYTTPRLQEYGHVARLTLSGGSTRSEQGNPLRRQA